MHLHQISRSFICVGAPRLNSFPTIATQMKTLVETHGDPWGPMGTHEPMGTYGDPWGPTGTSCVPMCTHGNSMGTPWAPHGHPWGPHGHPMGSHGEPWGAMETPRGPMGRHGETWGSMCYTYTGIGGKGSPNGKYSVRGVRVVRAWVWLLPGQIWTSNGAPPPLNAPSEGPL